MNSNPAAVNTELREISTAEPPRPIRLPPPLTPSPIWAPGAQFLLATAS